MRLTMFLVQKNIVNIKKTLYKNVNFVVSIIPLVLLRFVLPRVFQKHCFPMFL